MVRGCWHLRHAASRRRFTDVIVLAIPGLLNTLESLLVPTPPAVAWLFSIWSTAGGFGFSEGVVLRCERDVICKLYFFSCVSQVPPNIRWDLLASVYSPHQSAILYPDLNQRQVSSGKFSSGLVPFFMTIVDLPHGYGQRPPVYRS